MNRFVMQPLIRLYGLTTRLALLLWVWGKRLVDLVLYIALLPWRQLRFKKLAEVQQAKAFRITCNALDAIKQTIGSRPAEYGGLLGGSRDDFLITEFHFDESAHRTSGTYSPHTVSVNKLLRDEWNPAGINLLGFVHSHPPGLRVPSGGDLAYAARILDHVPDLKEILLPLVISEADTGDFEFLPFAVVRDSMRGIRVEKRDLVIVDATQGDTEMEQRPTVLPPFSADELAWRCIGASIHRGRKSYCADDTFKRVKGAYDLARMARSRVIYVGCGGAAAFAEDLARAGVGEHVLIDADSVSVTNLATQQVYRKDVGRPKVDCIAERIADINPDASILTWNRYLDEDISDDEFERLALGVVPGSAAPVTTLICGLTDSFWAQARINRLALKFGLPSLCAQVYEEGRGAEITFTYPGITPACHRCILSSRYEAFLNKGFTNDVTSDGTPICATTRLNALKAFMSLAILHHGTCHPRWGGFLERVGNRNLIQIRMDPDIPLKIFEKVFGGGMKDRILFDEAVWLPQDPDGPNGRPTCPDCGGIGDLRREHASLLDTRISISSSEAVSILY